jgi:hypothetical protein
MSPTTGRCTVMFSIVYQGLWAKLPHAELITIVKDWHLSQN